MIHLMLVDQLNQEQYGSVKDPAFIPPIGANINIKGAIYRVHGQEYIYDEDNTTIIAYVDYI